MEVFPGSEFRIAFEEAKACGAKIVLGDRDVQVIYIFFCKHMMFLSWPNLEVARFSYVSRMMRVGIYSRKTNIVSL